VWNLGHKARMTQIDVIVSWRWHVAFVCGDTECPLWVGPLSSRHGASSWRTDGEYGLWVWWVAADTLNKQLWTADGWFSSFGVRHELTTPHRKNKLVKNVTKGLILGQILWVNDLK
jgi:hypothetical protein